MLRNFRNYRKYGVVGLVDVGLYLLKCCICKVDSDVDDEVGW